jgi:large subunit ribosomal protein L16
MLLQPKRTKYRKAHKGRIHGIAHKASELTFGQYGLKAMSAGRITGRQIEAARRAMTRHIKRGGRIWIRMFPNVPVSGKPAEVRQGKGKGNVEYWIARVKPGRILYEMEGVTEELARDAMARAAAKLPIPTKFVNRRRTA